MQSLKSAYRKISVLFKKENARKLLDYSLSCFMCISEAFIVISMDKEIFFKTTIILLIIVKSFLKK